MLSILLALRAHPFGVFRRIFKAFMPQINKWDQYAVFKLTGLFNLKHDNLQHKIFVEWAYSRGPVK